MITLREEIKKLVLEKVECGNWVSKSVLLATVGVFRLLGFHSNDQNQTFFRWISFNQQRQKTVDWGLELRNLASCLQKREWEKNPEQLKTLHRHVLIHSLYEKSNARFRHGSFRFVISLPKRKRRHWRGDGKIKTSWFEENQVLKPSKTNTNGIFWHFRPIINQMQRLQYNFKNIGPSTSWKLLTDIRTEEIQQVVLQEKKSVKLTSSLNSVSRRLRCCENFYIKFLKRIFFQYFLFVSLS